MGFFNLGNLYILLLPVFMFSLTYFMFSKFPSKKIYFALFALIFNIVPISRNITGPLNPTITSLDGDILIDFYFVFLLNILAVIFAFFLSLKKRAN